VGGYAAPGDRAHVLPTVEATTVVGWFGLMRRARHARCGRGGDGEEGQRKAR
jgi:hypothetical protein